VKSKGDVYLFGFQHAGKTTDLQNISLPIAFPLFPVVTALGDAAFLMLRSKQ
jgi:hypothetical protein